MSRNIGPWKITKTVHIDRRNLFSLAPHEAHHIGTIVSGSRTQIGRFENDLRVIEAAPAMHAIIKNALVLLNDFAFIQNARAQELRREMNEILDDLACS